MSGARSSSPSFSPPRQEVGYIDPTDPPVLPIFPVIGEEEGDDLSPPRLPSASAGESSANLQANLSQQRLLGRFSGPSGVIQLQTTATITLEGATAPPLPSRCGEGI